MLYVAPASGSHTEHNRKKIGEYIMVWVHRQGGTRVHWLWGFFKDLCLKVLIMEEDQLMLSSKE